MDPNWVVIAVDALLFGFAAALIGGLIWWRERPGEDNHWCQFHREWRRKWTAIAAEIENAGGERGDWLANKITEHRMGERQHCGDGS